MPALRLVDMVRNGPVMGMVVVWVIVNVAFGAMSLPMPGFEGQIAWQAHLAGFAAGCCCSASSIRSATRSCPPEAAGVLCGALLPSCFVACAIR